MRWLLRITQLRADDLQRAGPLALAYGLVMAALYVLKPVRNALFLDRFGVDALPGAMIMVAIVGALTAAGYGHLARSTRVDRLVLSMFMGFIFCLLGFRLLLPLGYGESYYAFYVWVALYGLVAVSLLWQLANLRFNAREARRVFGIIGTGGISGAICGGLLTGGLADALGTENLMLVAAGLLVAAWWCLRAQAQPATPASRPTESAPAEQAADGALSAIRSSRLLSWMVLTVALIGLISVVVDIQFNDAVQREFPSKNEKTAFFGEFYAYFNGLAIAVQLALTTRVLTTLGVGWALLVLPLSLALGTLGLVVAPGVLAASLLKMADGSLRHSIHKSAFEILFIPIPSATKKQAKLFLDATVDSTATGAGALLVMFLVREFDVEYIALSGLSGVLLLGLFMCVWGLRRAYLDTLRHAFEKRELDPSELTIDITEAGAVEALIDALDDDRSLRRSAYVLEMLGSVRDPRLPARVRPFLTAQSADVRLKALRVLAAQELEQDVLDEVFQLQGDPDHGVRVEALRLLNAHSEQGPIRALDSQLHSDRVSIRAAALGVIATSGSPREKALVTPELLDDLLGLEGPAGVQARLHAATVLGSLERSGLDRYWQRLRNDASEAVVRETIKSAGQTESPEHVPWLFGLLADRRFRMDARLALSQYGETVIDEIDRRMADPDVPDRMWRVLPRILARIESQRCVTSLIAHARGAQWERRRSLIEALGKLRKRFPSLRFEQPGVDELLSHELESCYLHLSVMRVLPKGEPPQTGMSLLANTLAQRRTEALARVFALLALRYPPRDIENAHSALCRGRPEEVASALEFLDNLLTWREKEHLFPLVDPEQMRALEQAGSTSFGPRWPTSLPEAVQLVMTRSDPWLRACAVYAMKGADPIDVAALAQMAANDSDPIVRETGETLLVGPLQVVRA
ncbi:MAG: Npt1/Npt2 family nucleotide transporter [Myxococcales bacterium]|nr:Npt1/Npt2 family nucleotide transporter [Myxococcales bacterium]